MRLESATTWLPVLVAMAMLSGGGPPAMPAGAALMTLCSGGTSRLPGKPMPRDCDKACHATCSRRKRGP